jgi:hypothetical protein
MNFINSFLSHKYNRLEPVLFWLLVIISLIPIWSVFAFITVDGQGHIYNGQVLWTLATERDSYISAFTEINSSLSPNWIAHPIIALLSPFFSPFNVEKIIVSLYVVLFVFSFRRFIQTFFCDQSWISLSGFLFVWSSTVVNGFFNYNFGVALLFLNLAFLKKFTDQPGNKNAVVLGVGIILLYFCHLIPFCVFGLVSIAFIVSKNISMQKEGHVPLWRNKSALIKLGAAVFIPALLLSSHLISMHSGRSGESIVSENIGERILKLSGYNCISDREWIYSRWFYFIIIPVSVISIGLFMWKKTTLRSFQTTSTNFTLILSLIALLACVYLLPNGTTLGGGMLTVRLIYLTTTFFFVLLLFQIKQPLLQVVVLSPLFIVQIDKQSFIHREYVKQQDFLKVVDRARLTIEGKGLMYIADFNRKWPLAHATDALGYRNDVILTDTWFHKSFNPVIWKNHLPMTPENMDWLDNEGKCNTSGLESSLQTKVRWYVVAGNPNIEKYDSIQWSHCSELLESQYEKYFEAKDTLTIYHLKKY